MIYFYQNEHGEIFPTEEKTAPIYHKKYTQIGVSDGTLYHQKTKEGREKVATLARELADIESLYDRTLAAKDKFAFEEFLSETDPKMVRANARIKELAESVKQKGEEYSQRLKVHNDEAMEAEIAVARGNFKTPPVNDMVVYDSRKGGIQLVRDESEKTRILGS